MRLVLASANPDKAAEISAILQAASRGSTSRPARPVCPTSTRPATTLVDNARLKAAAIAAATGEAAVADDTGLAVDALGGAPGVWSARFAGEGATYADNVAKLLRELAGVAPERRTARFETVALVRWPDGREVTATGAVEGVIATAARGQGRVRLRPGLRAPRGGRADVRRARRRGETRPLPPGTGVSGAGGEIGEVALRKPQADGRSVRKDSGAR